MPVCTKTDDESAVLNEKKREEILKYMESKIQEIVSRQRFRRVYLLNQIFHTSAKEVSDDTESQRKSPEYMRDLVQAICEFTATYSFAIPNNWRSISK